jgi:DNA ligase-1
MRFRALVEMFEKLEGVSSGNAIREILAAFFRSVPRSGLAEVAYLTLGKIGAEYQKVDLGLAEKMMIKALAIASAKPAAEVARLAKRSGDLGLVAAQTVRGRGGPSVGEVITTLRKISEASGAGSQERKLDLMSSLLRKTSAKEAKYIVRIALGNLRLGIAAATILDSLALAFKGIKDKTDLESAYEKTSDIGLVAGLAASKRPLKVGVSVGVPIKMMLAQRVHSWEELKAHLPGRITAEEKYDGERTQIHKKGEKIVIFSRRLENITHQYPEVLASLRKSIRVKECIIEGEVVAIDKRGRLLPFQLLMQRKRKYRTEEYARRIPVALFLFDLLYLAGRSYLEVSYPRRRKALEKIIRPSKIIRLARQVTSENLAAVQRFFKESTARGAEGIVAKSNADNSFYQAGTRGWMWIKWKKEYLPGAKDTYDLVVVGAFHGRGRRSGTYGSLLCAVYNEKQDRFETFTKLGAGFSDKMLADLPALLKKYASAGKPARVAIHKAMEPDFYFQPGVVVEVLGAEITKSPAHSSGYALRFPRLVRIRDDKAPEQATTTAEIKGM